MAVNHDRDWNVSAIQGKHADYIAAAEVSEWLTFNNPVEQDVMIECDQYATRLFPSNPTCDTNEYFP